MAFMYRSSFKQGAYGEFTDLGGSAPFRFWPVEAEKYHLVKGSGRVLSCEMNDGLPVRRDNIPTTVRLEKKRSKMPDLWICQGFWMVCDGFKDLVESLEPDVHEFFPIKVVQPKGDVFMHTNMLNVCNRIDAIDHEHSSNLEMMYREPDWPIGYKPLSPVHGSEAENFLICKTAIFGTHLWMDRFYGSGDQTIGFCSNEVAAGIKAAKWKFIDLVPLREV